VDETIEWTTPQAKAAVPWTRRLRATRPRWNPNRRPSATIAGVTRAQSNHGVRPETTACQIGVGSLERDRLIQTWLAAMIERRVASPSATTNGPGGRLGWVALSVVTAERTPRVE